MDYTFDNKTYNFTDKELDILVDLTVWYCNGSIMPYDMRKIRSNKVRRYVTDKMHCMLVKNDEDGRYYPATYKNTDLDTMRFDPIYHSPPDMCRRLQLPYLSFWQKK